MFIKPFVVIAIVHGVTPWFDPVLQVPGDVQLTQSKEDGRLAENQLQSERNDPGKGWPSEQKGGRRSGPMSQEFVEMLSMQSAAMLCPGLMDTGDDPAERLAESCTMRGARMMTGAGEPASTSAASQVDWLKHACCSS